MKVVILLFSTILISISTSQECGRQKIGASLILGGEYAERGQFPWLAPLFKNKDDKYFCGSTIISKRHLLSASHCVNPKGSSKMLSPQTIHTLAGRFDFSDSDEPGAERIDIESISIHPDWSTVTEKYDADVAVLILKRDINFNSFVQPACLPEPGSIVFEVEGTVAGYGLSENTLGNHETKPKFAKISSVSQETCLFSDENIFKISSPRMFCAGEYGKNPCKGDSGSGFYVKDGNKYSVIGIVSSAVGSECEKNKYVLFTNVPKFIPWIKQELESIRNIEDESDWISKPLKCSFEDSPKDKRYECFAFRSFEATTSNVRVSSVDGSFIDGKSYSDVDTIVIKSSQVIYIPDMTVVMKKLPNVYQLFIVFCGLKYVERSKLAKMTQLRTLNFYGNNLESFEPDVFDDLVNLEIIAFVKNKIKTLPSELLKNLVNLKEIWSFDNPLEIIPRRFFKNNKKLEKAWMGTSKIKKIEVNFKALSKLTILDLRDNVCISKLGCPGCDETIEDVQDIIDSNC